MATIAKLHKVDGNLVDALNQAVNKVAEANGEVVLDFSGVRRVNPAALKSLEKLAAKTDEKGTKVVLRGVNVDIYKVLKLARLASCFSFAD